MAQHWTDVEIVGVASVVVSGTLLLPRGTSAITPVVVKANNGKTKRLLPAGVRADAGTAAVLPGDLLTKLGGAGATVQYRQARWYDIVRFRPTVVLQLGIAVLTLVAAVFAAISAYVGTRSPTTPTFTIDAAPWVLAITFVLAAGKLVTDIQAALA